LEPFPYDPDAVPNSGDGYTRVSWENWNVALAPSCSLNFQIGFDEVTGDVEYHYGAMTASAAAATNGTSATVWLEATDGLSARAVSINAPHITANTGYRFAWTP
jgi:hypothetical protein